MKRWFPPLIFFLCALLGCAPAIAPLPPLATPIPDSPQQYRMSLPKWRIDTVLTTNVHVYTETWVDNKVETSEERYVVRLNFVERTTGGHVRIRLASDGTTIGDMLFDEQGRVVDVFPAGPAFKEALQSAAQSLTQFVDSAAVRGLASTTLRRGESVRIIVPFAPFAQRFPPEYRARFAEGLPIDLTFTGYVRLGAVDAIAITTTMKFPTGPLYIPASGKKPERWLDDIDYQGHAYYDATSGHTLATHEVILVRGRGAGHSVSFRSIKQQTLDRARSSGF